MFRHILGVVVGYVVMAAFVFLTFSALYMALGADGTFEPGTYQVSMTWIIASIALAFAGAVLGGYVAVVLGRSRTTPMILAAVIFVFGIVMALPSLSEADTPAAVRTGEVAMMDAMSNVKEPVWIAFLNPVIGVIGVIVGARMRKNSGR